MIEPLSPSPIHSLPLTEGLRRAISRSNLGISELARRSGVDKGAMSRFVSGKGSLSLDSAEKIAKVIRWPIEVPRYVVYRVSAFRRQLCELRFVGRGFGGLIYWEAEKISEAKNRVEFGKEVFRCLSNNESHW